MPPQREARGVDMPRHVVGPDVLVAVLRDERQGLADERIVQHEAVRRTPGNYFRGLNQNGGFRRRLSGHHPVQQRRRLVARAVVAQDNARQRWFRPRR